MEKRVFVTEFIGLCNRLEALTLAFAIQEYYGHQVCLNWHELDAFRVVGTHTRGIGLSGRLNNIKIRSCTEEQFAKLGNYRNIIVRTYEGPPRILDRLYLPTAARLRLRPGISLMIREAFEPVKDRPVVGVHIRRGDFRLGDDSVYDAVNNRHPAVPLWWYEYAMGKIVERHKDVAFFLSCTGDVEEYGALANNFDLFSLPPGSPYTYKGEAHQSSRHPVADLFALACCPTIIATPMSTFSHYAANALGLPSDCILPPSIVRREAPLLGWNNHYGRRGVSRDCWNVQPAEGAGMLPELGLARLDWM